MQRVEKDMNRKEDMLAVQIDRTEKNVTQSMTKMVRELEAVVLHNRGRVEEVYEGATAILKETS